MACGKSTGDSPCDNIVSRRNVTLPHAQLLDECFFLAVLAGEVTVQSWSAQIEKTKTRRHTLNVQQMNLLLGIGAMGLTRRGLETNGRFTHWGTPREHRERRIG